MSLGFWKHGFDNTTVSVGSYTIEEGYCSGTDDRDTDDRTTMRCANARGALKRMASVESTGLRRKPSYGVGDGEAGPMRDLPLTQEAIGLAGEILNVSIRVDREGPLKDNWHKVAYHHLFQSMRTLTAIWVLVRQGAVHPAEILLRHLFELAVTLRYLDQYPKELCAFVRHYTPPLPENAVAVSVRQHVPKTSWRRLSQMCECLCIQADHYETLYRSTSEIHHGGVFRMEQEYRRLLGLEEVPDYEIANILFPAMLYYQWAIFVNRKLFPYLAPNFRSNDWSNRLRALEAKIHDAQCDLIKKRASGNR